MNTGGLSTLKHQLVFRGYTSAGAATVPNFIRVNYSKASDLGAYLELEKTVWQPFIKGQMETGNCSQVSWFAAGKIMPTGQDYPFNAVSVDGFTKLSEAVLPATSYKTAPTYPDLTEINEVHVKQRIQVYRLVKEIH